MVIIPGSKNAMTEKIVYSLSTLAVMLIVSRFIVRIVDATVQIGDDLAVLLLFLLLVNAAIGWIGYKLYRASNNRPRK